jgi:O-antigen/teichoic acid export membrane protein
LRTKVKQIFANPLLKKGIGDSSYYLIANVGSKAIGLLIIPILARSVSIEEFANYDLFILISAFLQIFVILGVDSGITILMAESKDDDAKLSFFYVTTLLISMSLLLILSLIFGTIFIFIDELFSLHQDMWILIGLYILFTVINYHTFNFLRWRTEAKKAAFINLFAYLIGIFIGLYCLYIDKTIESYLTGLIIGSFLGALVSLYISREYIKQFKILSDSKALLIDLFKLSLPFVPNYIGNNLMQMADRVIILMLFGKHELGLYAIIMRLAAIPQFIAGTITGGFLPVMYNNYKTDHGKKLIRNFFNTYFVLIPIFFVGAYLLSDILVELFAGKEYAGIAYLFPMALVSILFVNGTQGAGFGYTIKRKTHYIMYITFLSVGINFLFSMALGYWVGTAGIILGTLIAGIFRVYAHIIYSEKLYHFGYNFKLLGIVSTITFALSYYSFLTYS